MSSDEAPELPPAPLETDLYETLEVAEDATQDQIKSAYKKLALRNHPDKARPENKEEASKKFQQIAFAYAVLSDERRRRRFDQTGSTAEAFEDEDDFDWADFYREQFSSAVDVNALEELKKEYQGSDEEKNDLLTAFEKFRGDMDKIYDSVMLCNVLDDDERFRAVIEQAIADGRVEKYKKYVEESEKKRQQRVKRAQKEAEEAEQLSKKLEKKKQTSKGAKGKKETATGGDDLAALIRQRQNSRAESMFSRLEEKYGANQKKGTKRGAKFEEPPEEAFQATAARQASKKKKNKA
ncbi:DnaJ domain-containing protein [Aspergillus avenaceus]|uniref:DnaJ domain-containing protein n=1 Tax=Aspergillus avenaceus TaxID=36643 RepID=A0A5N6TDD4_ASPAV|nr:DnaJ domain-containing protein [Aspergillus avenaceus]